MRPAVLAAPRPWRAARCWLLAAGVGFAACAQGAGVLTISQISETEEHQQLLAFVYPAATVSKAGSTTEAALGDRPLKVLEVKAADPAAGLSVVLAIDVSQSMRQVGFDGVKNAVADFLSGLPPPSRAALLTIGATVSTAVRFGPVAAVASKVATLEPNEPDTALNDGLQQAQSLGASDALPPLRHAVVLVTDGLDDDKKAIGTQELLSTVARLGIPIYAVAITRRGSAGLEPFAQVVRASGGAFLATRPEALDATLKRLAEIASDAAMARIDCTGCPRDGQVRELQVREHAGNIENVGSRVMALFPNPTPPPPPPPPPDPSTSQASGATGSASHVEPPSFKLLFGLELPTVWQSILALLVALVGGSGIYAYKHPEEVTRMVRFMWIRPARTSSMTPASPPPPAGSSEARIVTLNVSEVGRMQVSVDKDIVIGRGPSAEVSTPAKDEEASTRHAALYVQNGVLMVRDLGSLNGTFLNGTRIVNSEPLHDRDVIRVGATDIRVFFGRI